MDNSIDQYSYNRGMVDAVEGATIIIDFAVKHGFDLQWVRSALLLGTAGLELSNIRIKQPISPKEASDSLKSVLEKIYDNRRRESR